MDQQIKHPGKVVDLFDHVLFWVVDDQVVPPQRLFITPILEKQVGDEIVEGDAVVFFYLLSKAMQSFFDIGNPLQRLSRVFFA